MKFKSLGTKSAVGATPALDITQDIDGKMTHAFGIQCNVTGDPLTITVDLEGSFDGTSWTILGTKVFSAPELAALTAMFHVIGKPVLHVRANVSTLTFTTAATVDTILLYGK